MRLSAEEESILLCLGAERTAAGDRLRELLDEQEPDWSRVWAAARQLQVEPLVARALTAPGMASSVPPTLVNQAKLVRLQTVGYNMAVHAELLRVAKALADRGIPTTPLKGTHLAERLYGALDARRVTDIDILVPEFRLQEARAALREMGYDNPDSDHGRDHPSHGSPFVRAAHARYFLVQLHWKLTDPRFVTIDYPELWERILANSPDESPLRPMPNEENLLYLAIHLGQDAGGGVLRLLGDIDRQVRVEGPRMDWADVLALAERWNGAWQLYAALYRAQLLFATPVPRWVLDRLTPAHWRRGLIDLLAGPRVIVRPAPSSRLNYHKFRLAYCAALSPFSRAWDGYVHFFLRSRPVGWRMGIVERTIDLGRGLISGLAWTGLCLAEALCALAAGLGARRPGLQPGR